MAKKINQEYVLKVVAEGLDGVTKQLKQLSKDLSNLPEDTDKVGKEFKKGKKLTDDFSTGLKGTGKATNNQTKAFSKMAESMSGTLVPAYATVAANVFALTAAFGALERAADLQILIDSAETLATQTGRSLVSLANNMKAITGEALSMKEALTNASLAASAGFDNTTIEKLTQVAKNASVALGRELTDSLNRVFKGAIKAEPELLDELGIILRLDTATRDYAAVLGKAAKDLTVFEKQQAVVNAVISQGEEKFSELAKVDINPYTRLAAAFHDVSASLINIVSSPIAGTLEFFTENVSALTAALVLFSTNVLKKAFPALSNFSKLVEATTINIKEKLQSRLQALEKIKINIFPSEVQQRIKKQGDNITKIFEKLRQDYIDANKPVPAGITNTLNSIPGSAQQASTALKSLGGIITAIGAKRSAIYSADDLVALQKAKESVETMNATLKDAGATAVKTEKTIGHAMNAIGSSVITATERMINFSHATLISMLGAADAVSKAERPFRQLLIQIKAAASSEQGLGLLERVGKTTGAAIGGLGAYLIRLVPIISTVTIAWSVLSEAFGFIKRLLVGEDIVKLSESLSTQEEQLATAAKSVEYYNAKLKDLPDTIDNTTKKLELQANVLVELYSNLTNVADDLAISSFGFFTNLLDAFALGDLDQLKDNLENTINAINKLGFNKEVLSITEKYDEILRLSGDDAKKLTVELQGLAQKLRDVTTSAKEANKFLLDTVDLLGKSLLELGGSLPSLTGVENSLYALVSTLDQLSIASPEKIVSSLEKLNTFELKELGIDKFITDISKIKAEIKGIESVIADLNATANEITNRATTFTFGDTIEARNEELKTINEVIRVQKDRITDLKNEYALSSNNIIKNLQGIRKQFEDIASAERKLETTRQALVFEQGVGEQNLEQRIALTEKLTSIEVDYFNTISKRAVEQLNSIKKVTEDVNYKLLSAQNEFNNLSKEENANKLELLALEDKIGRLNTEKQSYLKTELQLQKQIDETRNKAANEYLGQIKFLEKELDKISKLEGLGAGYFLEQVSVIESEMLPVLQKMYRANESTASQADILAKRYLTASINARQLAKDLRDARIDPIENIAADTKTSFATIEKLDIETKLNKDIETSLSNRLDKEYQINDAISQRRILSLENMLNVDNAEQIFALINVYEENRRVSESERLAYLDKEYSSILAITALETKALKDKNKLGALATAKSIQELEIARKITELQLDPTKAAAFRKEMEELNKQKLLEGLNSSIGDMITGFDSLTASILATKDAFASGDAEAKFKAGLISIYEIGGQIGGQLGKTTQGLAAFSAQAAEYNKLGEEATFQDKLALANTALAAIGPLMKEGSKGAKALMLAQQALAIANAAAAVTAAGVAPPPTGLASAAAMLALVTSVLGAAGVAFGGSSESGQTAGQDYTDRYGENNLLDNNLYGNSLIKSIDKLVDVDSDLFSATRELQLTMRDLADTFSKIAAQFSTSFGRFDQREVEKVFGTAFGDISSTPGFTFDDLGIFSSLGETFDALSFGLAGDLLGGFSSTDVSTKLLAAGINFNASLNTVGESISGTFSELRLFMEREVKIVEESFYGLSSSTSRYTETVFADMNSQMQDAFSKALNGTLNVITSLLRAFSGTVDVNFSTLLSRLNGLNLGAESVRLDDLSPEEQVDAIAQYFSSVTEKVIDSILPWLDRFSIAGEDLGDTLIRLTTDILNLSNAFASVGGNISQYINISGVDEAARSIINRQVEELRNSLIDVSQYTEAPSGGFTKTIANSIRNITNSALITAANAFNLETSREIAVLESSIDSFAESLKLQIVASWTDSFNKNFKDTDEFTSIFSEFATTLYNDSELATLRIAQAENNIAAGFSSLTSQLSEAGLTDLVSVINQQGNTVDAIRSIYELGNATGAFAASIDTATGEIDTSGADLLSTVIKLGASFGYLDDIVEELDDKVGEFERRLLRQIEAFGLVGKELDLLELSFDYEDTLEEARSIGANIALVEQAFGLERLDIIRRYNKEIVDSIDNTYTDLENAILDIRRSFEGWDEVIYQSIKIDSIARRLGNSLGNIDLSIFNLSGDLDSIETFREAFEDILVFSNETPQNIQEQVNLVKELQESVIDRYNIEAAAIEDLQSKLKDLSMDIKNFLDDLLLSDLSPLTNAEKLQEAQNQFTENLSNITSEDSSIADRARENLLDSANALLEQASLFYSIGPAFEAIFDNVYSSLANLDQDIVDQLNTTNDDIQSQALLDLRDLTLSQLDVLNNVLYELELQNTDSLTLELQSLGEDITTHLDFIVNKLDSINDSSWSPLLSILSGLNSYDVGTSYVEYDQLAMIHKGEAILTANTADSVRSGNSVVTNNYSNGSSDNGEVVQAIRQLIEVVASGNSDLLEQGEKLEKATIGSSKVKIAQNASIKSLI